MQTFRSSSTREEHDAELYGYELKPLLDTYKKRKDEFDKSGIKHRSREVELAYEITNHFFALNKDEFSGELGAKKAANFQSLVYMLVHRSYDDTFSKFKSAKDKNWRYFLACFRKNVPNEKGRPRNPPP